jgi:hypothetical protein
LGCPRKWATSEDEQAGLAEPAGRQPQLVLFTSPVFRCMIP